MPINDPRKVSRSALRIDLSCCFSALNLSISVEAKSTSFEDKISTTIAERLLVSTFDKKENDNKDEEEEILLELISKLNLFNEQITRARNQKEEEEEINWTLRCLTSICDRSYL